MNNCRKIAGTAYKDMLTKGLTGVMLLVSLFLFSGYVNTSQSPGPEIARIELPASANRAVGKRTISFQQAMAAASVAKPLIAAALNSFALQGYNRLVMIKAQHMASTAWTIERPGPSIPLKTIPQSSDEPFSMPFSA